MNDQKKLDMEVCTTELERELILLNRDIDEIKDKYENALAAKLRKQKALEIAICILRDSVAKSQ